MKKTLMILGLLGLVMLPAKAALTNVEASSRDYLINHGHSTDAANTVEKVKAGVNGETYFNPNQKEYTTPVRWLRNLFIYFDPALDYDNFYGTDIKPTPQYDDL